MNGREARLSGGRQVQRVFRARRGGLVAVAALGFLVLGVLGMAVATGNLNGNYQVSIDALTAGGGNSESGLYREKDSAIGQSMPCGPSASANYKEESGVVLPWGPPPGASLWIAE